MSVGFELRNSTYLLPIVPTQLHKVVHQGDHDWENLLCIPLFPMRQWKMGVVHQNTSDRVVWLLLSMVTLI